MNDFLGGAAVTTVASTERPLLEVVTVVSRGTNILERSCVPPAGASERVQGWSAGGDDSERDTIVPTRYRF